MHNLHFWLHIYAKRIQISRTLRCHRRMRNNEATSSCVVWEVKDLIKWIPSLPSWPSSTATPIQSVNPWKSCTCSSSPPFLDNPWYNVKFSTWTSSPPFSGYLSVGVSKNLIFLKIEQKRWNML